jgi:hypothetical protein
LDVTSCLCRFLVLYVIDDGAGEKEKKNFVALCFSFVSSLHKIFFFLLSSVNTSLSYFSFQGIFFEYS